MMIGVEMYLELLKDAPYQDLIKERDKLIRFIRKFEKEGNQLVDEKEGYFPNEFSHPCPEVKYQMYLLYLSALCIYMRDTYSHNFVFGNESLFDEK